MKLTQEQIEFQRKYSFPHCDPDVLHEPGKCKWCDYYPDRQQARMDNNINFTGPQNQDKLPCPAVKRRGLENIERWNGNRTSIEFEEIMKQYNEAIKKRFFIEKCVTGYPDWDQLNCWD
jgi:hypothetical protein